MEKKDEGGNDGLPAPALKTEKESKYQGAFQEDDAIEDGASLISALAFGDVSPRRPPKSPAAATATENSIETIPSKDGDETQQTVAFQEEDTIIDPPTLSRGQTKDSIAPRPGPGHLKESLALPEDGHDPGSMAYIYQEGIQTPFRSRVAVANVVRKENKVDIESGKCTWRQMTATPVWDFKEPMNPIERRAAMVKKYADRNYYSEDDVAQYRLHSSNVNVSRHTL